MMTKIMLPLVLAFVLAMSAFAQKSEVFIAGQGAIRGYDPVAYFTESKPVKGTKEFIYQWKGADWYFSSAQNLASFKAYPEKFAPQYGGYCAYGTSKGYKAPTDPDAWTVVDGKLYLNYNKDVQKTWNQDQKTYIQRADKNWPEVSKQE